jgi:GMP synthase (glutamine-hydrolysing)
MTSPLHLLVVDAYDGDGRAALRAAGGTPAGQLYARELKAVEGRSEIDIYILAITGGDDHLPGTALDDYDGIIWTGSNLSIHKLGQTVRTQIDLARAAFDSGVPQFGSCWAIQLAAVAAGGACAANPRGREFGIARTITPTPEGKAHPLLRGRGDAFDAFTSHEDIVVSLPDGASHLAGNEFSEIQALEARSGRGTFWAVQYHPEYDFHEVARLATLRRDQLIRQGRFRDEGEAINFIEDFEQLHVNPADEALSERHSVSIDVSDPSMRRLELRNWLDAQVKYRVSKLS